MIHSFRRECWAVLASTSFLGAMLFAGFMTLAHAQDLVQQPAPQAPKSGNKPASGQPSFEDALKAVLAAGADDFRPLVGKDGNVPDSQGHYVLAVLCCGHAYYPKVDLPLSGFTCGLVETDAAYARFYASSSSNSATKIGPPPFHYLCVSRNYYFGPTVEQVYHDLVQKVTLATGLPSWTKDGGFTKTETRPGSGVFEQDRGTVFSETPDLMKHPTVYVSVELNGQPGIYGGWRVDLRIGTHWPQ